MRRPGIASFCIVASTAFTAGAAVIPLDLEKVIEAPTLAAYSPPDISPDNALIAYVVTDPKRKRQSIDDITIWRSGVAWYGVGSDIWISDLSSGKHRNLTDGEGHSWTPRWSPDGKRLAFLRGSPGDPLGPARLWVWERKPDTLRQVGNADIRDPITGIEWSADSRSVLVSLLPEGMDRDQFAGILEGATPSNPESERSSGATAKVFEFDPSAEDAEPATDQMNLDMWLRDIALINVESGEVTRLTTNRRVGHATLSPDGMTLAYTDLVGASDRAAGQYVYDLLAVDVATRDAKTLADDISLSLLASSFSWSPDSGSIAWRTGGPTAEDEIAVVSAEGGQPRVLLRKPSVPLHIFEVSPPAWDSSGKNVYFMRDQSLWRAAVDGSSAAPLTDLSGLGADILTSKHGELFTPNDARLAIVMFQSESTKKSGFARVDLRSGKLTRVLEENMRYGGYGTLPSVSPDGSRLAFVAEDPTTPPDVFVAGGDPFRTRRVTSVAPALANRPLGRAEVLEWRGIDGDIQRGALIYPAGYERGSRYPLIVKVYGGSAISNDLNRYGFASAAYENLQIYATRGYAILLADSEVNVGTPMVDLMKSVMPGINAAVEKGVADPDRVGVTGHSYGGYSTLALIAQSSRFKAAVMRAGFGNLIGAYGALGPDGTNYGLSWAEGGQGRMGGHPWEYRERYLENSPYFHLDQVETPLLIIHGTEDTGVPVYLADEIFTALRRLGKTVTYARYEGEDHWEGSWSHANQIDALRRSIAWFDRYLRDSKESTTGSKE